MAVRRPDPELHRDLAMLAPFIGTWSGHGTGSYPGTDPFTYEERLVIECTGGRFLVVQQRTTNPETGLGMHAETGYWRPVPPDRLEVVIAQPTGLAEVQEGTVDGGRVELRSTAVVHATTALRVDVIDRSYRVKGDVLRYTVRMAALGNPVADHLEAELHRTD